MTVALTMARMKLAIVRHSMSGRRRVRHRRRPARRRPGGGHGRTRLHRGRTARRRLRGVAAGLAARPDLHGRRGRDGPPGLLHPLGLPPRRLAAGLLTAAFVGAGPALSLLALGGLVVLGAGRGAAAAAVALPAAVLQLALFVLLSKVVVALFGLVLRSRTGAIASGVLNALVLALLSQGWVVAVAYGEAGGLPPAVDAVLHALPSGWGVVAVESAAQGRWALSAGVLAGQVLLVALLLAAWAGPHGFLAPAGQTGTACGPTAPARTAPPAFSSHDSLPFHDNSVAPARSGLWSADP